MAEDNRSNLVSINWLQDNLSQSKLIILDATMKKKPNGEVIPTPKLKIPGALIFNFDTEVCDQNTHLPHMLCTPKEFQTVVRKLGISTDSNIVIYDSIGIFSSPRAWWMFKIMGHENVFVLDGGLPKWIEAGETTTTDYKDLSELIGGDFQSNFNQDMIYSSEQVLRSIENRNTQVLDARSIGRFNAIEAEPRPGLKGGHIPKSKCIPFTEVMKNGFFKSKDELKNIFNNESDKSQLVFTCGSGVTASILALAADEIGYQNVAVYDGSWTEWANNNLMPIISNE